LVGGSANVTVPENSAFDERPFSFRFPSSA
jgi:hypothetical protein